MPQNRQYRDKYECKYAHSPQMQDYYRGDEVLGAPDRDWGYRSPSGDLHVHVRSWVILWGLVELTS
jgi:hypothetical protein